MILLYYTLGTSSLTLPAGTYTLELVAPRLVESHVAVAIAGGAWNLIVTLLALKGLKVAARFEWAVVVFQYLVLLLVAAAGIAALARADSSAVFSWNWLTIAGMGGMRSLMGGILIACFMYSGWDAAIYVNEESSGQSQQPRARGDRQCHHSRDFLLHHLVWLAGRAHARAVAEPCG